jgi:hypothetical protein
VTRDRPNEKTETAERAEDAQLKSARRGAASSAGAALEVVGQRALFMRSD